MFETSVMAGVPIALDPVRGSLGQLRASQEALGQFLEHLFSDLEQRERNEVAGEDLQRRQIEELLSDRATLERELNSARDEITRLAGTAVELANVRSELAEARSKSGRMRDQLASVSSIEQDLRAALADAELERRSLEAELDILRRRSAELAEDLAEHKRQSAEERAGWNAELREWRRLFEKQSALLAASHAAPARSEATAMRRPARSAGAGDPVLGAVLAQFEMFDKTKPPGADSQTAPS